ncbi:MAG: CRISPR-associated protein [Pauljensenia sp.]|nr:CRISPR-associated protein [Pauljensenia sp.]
MTTASPTTSPTASGHVTIVFTSDWGVSTGVGQAGRTHSTIERCGDDPVVRGTVITGVLREQAMLAAKALDGPEEKSTKKWTSFALWLFGQDPNSEPGSTPHPRHVLFSDATPASSIPIHDTVSLSIDPQTGTARNQFLRFTERAAAGVLTGTFTLIDEAGAEPSGKSTIEAARFLLGVAGLMVRGIGSGRSGGDGECTVLVTNHEVEARAGQSTSEIVAFASSHAQALRGTLKSLAQALKDDVNALPSPRQEGAQHQVGTVDGSAAQHSGRHHLILDLTLDSPIVSYEVPFSNEIRSLDFLRGTVLLPWLHRLVSSKGHGGNEAVITNAVTGGHLFVSDALPVIGDIKGLPVPLTLKTDKPSDSPITLYGDSPKNKGKLPVRGGYVFFGPEGGDGKEPGTKTQGWYGKPPLRGRQTTAINHETGAASKGQLVLVDALPEGMCMRAHVWVSDELWEAASVSSLLGRQRVARFGSRKLTGTFGSAHCTLREETDDEREARSYFGNAGSTQLTSTASTSADGTAPGEGTTTSSDDQRVSLWFTSDVIARSAGLGAGGTVDDLIRAFRREGIIVEAVGTPSIRHRRVDSWSPADNGPRASRLAIQAGSVIQVHVSEKKDRAKLLELAPFGVGELTAQGYGRFVVDHPLLSIGSIKVTKAKLEHFVCEETPKGGEDK